MKKKIVITIIVTIIITLLFIIIKNLIYGTDIDYIADYMPGEESLRFNNGKYETYYASAEDNPKNFFQVAHKTAMIRLFIFFIFDILFSIFYTKTLFKTKVYTNKKDLIYSLIVFAIPLIICYMLIYYQLSYTS